MICTISWSLSHVWVRHVFGELIQQSQLSQSGLRTGHRVHLVDSYGSWMLSHGKLPRLGFGLPGQNPQSRSSVSLIKKDRLRRTLHGDWWPIWSSNTLTMSHLKFGLSLTPVERGLEHGCALAACWKSCAMCLSIILTWCIYLKTALIWGQIHSEPAWKGWSAPWIHLWVRFICVFRLRKVFGRCWQEPNSQPSYCPAGHFKDRNRKAWRDVKFFEFFQDKRDEGCQMMWSFSSSRPTGAVAWRARAASTEIFFSLCETKIENTNPSV